MAILISNKLRYDHQTEIKDKEGRYILIKGQIEGAPVTFLNVYVPPGSKFKFYQKVFDMISTETQGPLICGGDFNIILNSKMNTSILTEKPITL